LDALVKPVQPELDRIIKMERNSKGLKRAYCVRTHDCGKRFPERTVELFIAGTLIPAIVVGRVVEALLY
jgi:hypothetical protein